MDAWMHCALGHAKVSRLTSHTEQQRAGKRKSMKSFLKGVLKMVGVCVSDVSVWRVLVFVNT